MLEVIIQTVSTFGEVIAVAITGFSAWVGYRQLQKPPEQQVKPSKKSLSLTPDTGGNDYKSSLIVFDSDNQRTTLRANSKALECYLSDFRPNKVSAIQWRLTASEVRSISKKNDFEIKSGYKIKTGTFRIGNRRNWLYSKLLFPEPSLLEQKLTILLNSFDES